MIDVDSLTGSMSHASGLGLAVWTALRWSLWVASYFSRMAIFGIYTIVRVHATSTDSSYQL